MKNIGKVHFGSNQNYIPILEDSNSSDLYLIDSFFKNKNNFLKKFPIKINDFIFYVETINELTTKDVNNLKTQIKKNNFIPDRVIGIGGGTTLDFAKAISNLINNHGNAEDYQGWDLLKNKGVYKIGIPTLSGTGAESSRTCVMINNENGLKLGMNSEFTIFDELILDPVLSNSVPNNQYFYTGMDTFIHSFESLSGIHRHAMSDTYSEKAIDLVKEVFESSEFKSIENREKLMIASYFGGIAIANSFVGVVHPFSAGLSVVLGIHHCEANCIAMRGMESFYKQEYDLFWNLASKNNINIKKGICRNLTDTQYKNLYNSTIIHKIPLANALGDNFKEILEFNLVKEIFKKM